MRINARLNHDLDEKVEFLRQKTGLSVTDLVKIALSQYYNRVVCEEQNPNEILLNSGFIGSGLSDENLSENYKSELTEQWEIKHDHC